MSLPRYIRLMALWGNGPVAATIKGFRFWLGRSVYIDPSQSAFR